MVDPEYPKDVVPNPAPYFRRYQAPPVRRTDVKPDSIVVLPEIYARLVRTFPGSEVFFWWLSVDNFVSRATRMLRGRLPAPGVIMRSQLELLRSDVALHLYQSEYARMFLEANHLAPAEEVSDYLSEEYLSEVLSTDTARRENVVAYNTARGLERTRLVMRAFERLGTPTPDFVPVAGLDRTGVRELLRKSKIYLDLGNHPGKDRLPREAIACGACVLTNYRGSAGNAIDVPLSSWFKIDDRVTGFDEAAVRKIQAVLGDFEKHRAANAAIRQSLAYSPAEFRNQVDKVFLLADASDA